MPIDRLSQWMTTDAASETPNKVQTERKVCQIVLGSRPIGAQSVLLSTAVNMAKQKRNDDVGAARLNCETEERSQSSSGNNIRLYDVS